MGLLDAKTRREHRGTLAQLRRRLADGEEVRGLDGHVWSIVNLEGEGSLVTRINPGVREDQWEVTDATAGVDLAMLMMRRLRGPRYPEEVVPVEPGVFRWKRRWT